MNQCPNCKSPNVKKIGDECHFCLDCDWDDMIDYTEFNQRHLPDKEKYIHWIDGQKKIVLNPAIAESLGYVVDVDPADDNGDEDDKSIIITSTPQPDSSAFLSYHAGRYRECGTASWEAEYSDWDEATAEDEQIVNDIIQHETEDEHA